MKKFILYATSIAVLVIILMASLNTSSTQPPFTLATIKPGDPWLDNRGLPIQTHGGGILKVSDTFYWFGQDYSTSNDLNLRYIGCYSSTNLINWTYQNQVVKLADPEKLGSGWVLERPRVYYNAPTKKFVLYAHIDNRSYGFAKVAIFICDTVDGNYQYVKSFRPLGHESRDLGQFVDNDGTAYLIFEDRFYGFRIAKLSADYLDVEKEMCLIRSRKEGSALLHYNGLYYIIVSELTSWDPNPNTYATAKSLAGPWSKFKNIAPPDKKHLRLAVLIAIANHRHQNDHCHFYGRHLETTEAMGFALSLDAAGNRRWEIAIARTARLDAGRGDRSR